MGSTEYILSSTLHNVTEGCSSNCELNSQTSTVVSFEYLCLFLAKDHAF